VASVVEGRRNQEGITSADDDPARIGLDPAYVLPTRLLHWADIDPQRPFLVEVTERTGRTLTYGEFHDEVRRWCARLIELGVTRGDRVLTLLPTSVDSMALWVAAGWLGAVDVPVNPELTGTFLRHVVTDARAVVCVARPEFVEGVQAVGARVNGVAQGEALLTVAVGRDGSWTAQAVPADLAEVGVCPAPEDPSCVMYTSGTTGVSKGVVVTWGQMTATIGRIPRTRLSSADATYSYHPTFHVTGRSPLPAMADVGGRVVLRERLSVTDFWTDVRRFGCTTTTVNPALLLTPPPRPDDRDHPLRLAMSGGSRALAVRFAERFGVELLEAYGSTEIGFPIVLRHMGDPEDRTCGFLRLGYDARIVATENDEGSHGRDVEPGEPGELWVRPPADQLMMTGYLLRPEQTAAAVVDGWYRTGDRMVRRADGSFVFLDRMSDTIRRHGENISASGLEAVLLEDPDIVECAAIGVPDAVAGQQVWIVVRLSGGASGSEADLYERFVDVLPKHMRPLYVSVVNEMPRTSTNKIMKSQLLDGFATGRVWTATTPRDGLARG
jgi:carnitine-CoA ligase